MFHAVANALSGLAAETRSESATWLRYGTAWAGPVWASLATVPCRRDALPTRKRSEEAHDNPATVEIGVRADLAVQVRDRFVVAGTTYQVEQVTAVETYAVERICTCTEVWT